MRAYKTSWLVATLVMAGTTAAYFLWVVCRGGLRDDGGNIIFHAKDYYWRFEKSPILAGRWLAGAFVLGLLVMPRLGRKLWHDRGRIAAFLIICLLWLLAMYDILDLARSSWPVHMVCISTVCGCAYLAWRLETSSRIIARTVFRIAQALRSRRATWLIALLAVAILTAGTALIYRFLPLIVDAQSQVAQARILLSGRWSLPVSSAVRAVIEFPNSTSAAPVYSFYPPGHIVLLLPLVALKISANFLNVLAGACVAVLTCHIGRVVAGRLTGIIAALLLLGSPWFFAMNSSAMNHGTATLELTAAACCLLIFRAGHFQKSLLLCAGFCFGFALATRPLTAAVHVAVWSAAWLAAWRRPGLPKQWLLAPLYCLLGAALPLAGFAYYNLHTTGKPFLLQYTVAEPEFVQLGFIHTARFLLTPEIAVHHLFSSFVSLNDVLFGWPTGSLILLAAWWARTRLRTAEIVLIALCAAQVTAYFFYHFFQLFLGPRFWYELLPFLAVFAAIPLARASRVLPRGSLGIVAITWLLFSAAGLVYAQRRWHREFMPEGRLHFIQFVQSQMPLSQPTVIVIPDSLTDVVGQLLEAGGPGRPMLLFVKDDNEKRARDVLELQNFQWIRYVESTVPPEI